MKNHLLLFASFVFTVSLFAKDGTGFVENKGQLADANGNPLNNVLFRSTGTGPALFITTSGLTCVFKQKQSPAGSETTSGFNWSKIEIELAGASIIPGNITTENQLPGVSNFYYAHCTQGITGVKTWERVILHEVYPGIDWVVNANEISGVSHDFIVHPGADVAQIKLLYKGADKGVLFDESGKMIMHSAYGTLLEGPLNVFEEQSAANVHAIINSSTVFKTTSHAPGKIIIARCGLYADPNARLTGEYVTEITYGFDANYNRNTTIVIDPPLQWDMPQTSAGFDYGYGVAAVRDGSGDAVFAGTTDGTDFPTLNAYQGSLSGTEDMVIMRLDGNGTRLWSTYYGGTSAEGAKGISTDNSGNCYVAGYTTSSNFPTLLSGQLNYGGGTFDAAAIKFNTAGVRQWATWLGGIGTDYGTAIVADSVGNCYVTGYTGSTNFPTVTPLQATKNTGYDAFITKYSTIGVMQWSTFFGGDDEDKARAITLDAGASNLYITGTTLSGGFPVTAGSFQNSSASAYFAEDGFVLKMNPSSQAVSFCSYLGGGDADFAQGIAVDATGVIYITGYTLSSDFPVANPGGNAYVDSTIGSLGTHDAFIMSCNSTGTTRTWSTYFGGSSPDMGFSISCRANSGIFICGNTASIDFPTQVPFDNMFFQGTQGDGGNFNDMFIAWFDGSDSLLWSTYYGDTNSNEAYGISVDATGFFVTGTDSNDLAAIKFTYSIPTAQAEYALRASFLVYPSPASSQLTVAVNSIVPGEATIELFNSAGQIIRVSTSLLSEGNNTLQIDIGNLAPGIYSIRYTAGNNTHIARFVKQ
jgi:hypothetical protein